MWQSILKAIVNGIIGAIKAWWNQEQKIAAEWLAKSREGQLESFKSTLEVESKLGEAMSAVGEDAISPADWNAGK